MPHPPSPDVLIVGGGIIGSSIAWRLARAGIRVTLCEARTAGGEASWAGAGMLVPGSEYDQPGEWLDFALRSLALYPEFVKELEGDSGRLIDFARCGSLELAATEAEFAILQERAQRQAALGIANEVLSASELAARAPGLRQDLRGAILYAKEGQVDPRTVCDALRAALLRHSVTVREQCPVVALYPHADGVDVRTEAGETISSTLVVVAAGAWSSQIRVGGPALPASFPVKGHLLGYHLAPGSIPHVLRYQRTYVVQRSTGYTIAGASEENAGFDRSLDSSVIETLARQAQQLIPGLPPQPDDAWMGFRPAAESLKPVLGQLGETPIWTAYGHYRNGILLAPATAERISATLRASLGKG